MISQPIWEISEVMEEAYAMIGVELLKYKGIFEYLFKLNYFADVVEKHGMHPVVAICMQRDPRMRKIFHAMRGLDLIKPEVYKDINPKKQDEVIKLIRYVVTTASDLKPHVSSFVRQNMEILNLTWKKFLIESAVVLNSLKGGLSNILTAKDIRVVPAQVKIHSINMKQLYSRHISPKLGALPEDALTKSNARDDLTTLLNMLDTIIQYTQTLEIRTLTSNHFNKIEEEFFLHREETRTERYFILKTAHNYAKILQVL